MRDGRWAGAANQTTEDREQASPTSILRHTFVRKPIKIWFQEDELYKERYGGALGIIVLEGELFKPPTVSETVCIFMHPMGIQNLLPMPMALARAGVHVVTCTSRYPNNDTTLIMEKARARVHHGGRGLDPCPHHTHTTHALTLVVTLPRPRA